MRKRGAFTLIELLVIIAIIGIMVTVSVANVRAGQALSRLKGATRDAFATIRHARAVALVTQKPAIITYSTESVDGEVRAKVEITTADLIKSKPRGKVVTLSGAVVSAGGDEGAEGGGGNTVEEVLFAPVSAEVMEGMRIKVTRGDERLETGGSEEAAKSKISVFSNVDYLLGSFRDAKAKDEEKRKVEAEAADGKDEAAAKAERETINEPVSIVWEVNGRTEPHQVWIYPDGLSPDQGLSIKIDRFGAAKILGTGEEDD